MVEPLDKLVLGLMFVFGSYIPALILTMLFRKPELPKFDPAMHVFNKPDALEMNRIYQTVTKI